MWWVGRAYCCSSRHTCAEENVDVRWRRKKGCFYSGNALAMILSTPNKDRHYVDGVVFILQSGLSLFSLSLRRSFAPPALCWSQIRNWSARRDRLREEIWSYHKSKPGGLHVVCLEVSLAGSVRAMGPLVCLPCAQSAQATKQFRPHCEEVEHSWLKALYVCKYFHRPRKPMDD